MMMYDAVTEAAYRTRTRLLRGRGEAEIFRPRFEPHLIFQRPRTRDIKPDMAVTDTEWKAEDFPCTLYAKSSHSQQRIH